MQHGFLLFGGSYTTLDVLGATSTQANGINDGGAVTGYSTAGSTTTGFVGLWWQLQFIQRAGQHGTNGWVINSAGTVSGYFRDSTGAHGFVGSGGTYTTLDDPFSSGPTHRVWHQQRWNSGRDL